MKSGSKLTYWPLILPGLVFIIFGMLSEFVLGYFLPSEVMQNLYANGGFLVIIIFFFVWGVILIRLALFRGLRYRYDSIVYLIAAIICLASAGQTIFGLQIGHPWLDLAQTNPVLLNILWMFVLPPMNPWITILISACFIFIALLNFRNTPTSEKISKNVDFEVKKSGSELWWEVLARLTRISVWAGSLFLFILSFFLLGSPPLNLSPWSIRNFAHIWEYFLIGIIAICCFNSAIFIINQLSDLDTDRLHHVKANLPISSGRLTKTEAILIAISFIIAGIIFASLVSMIFLIILLMTYFFAFIYSFPPIHLKSRPFLDLAIIGIGFGSWAVFTAFGFYTFAPITLLTAPVLPISLVIGAGVFYAGTHCIHTASDYSADAAAGIKTTAVFIGPKKASRLGVILIGVGFLLLYATVGLFTHLFWYGLLKYKTIFLLIFLGLPFFALFQQLRAWQQASEKRPAILYQFQKQGRQVTYLLFFLLIIYLYFYVYLFYPAYYPNYFFPWI